jgi:hypothetical protein
MMYDKYCALANFLDSTADDFQSAVLEKNVWHPHFIQTLYDRHVREFGLHEELVTEYKRFRKESLDSEIVSEAHELFGLGHKSNKDFMAHLESNFSRFLD